ncbi:hypothetical protein THAOC_37714 [Thalassiosira oceanica]|uniref:MYND-type domain-containing protein n=1 Tax=Thalassiosira oceanica TaxID=159749 RepID=K0QZP4_THAOC|nr:hypothetical protein THAOC_37714 [Thalassiosira oceanica]|eukprot:EJK43804.1 hypothetical protein THAOC_37714 [Thalassiosira oceanica]
MSDEPLTASTGPMVGDDEERQKTDEERLLDEIAEQKDLIDALTGDTCEEIAHRAPQKKLGQLEFKYQLLVEEKRLARVLLKFQELYGDLYTEPCLICLDDIHVHAATDMTEIFYCCGGFVCKSCAGDIKGLDKCPLCRESFAVNSAALYKWQVMTLAKRGVSWAQREAGILMIDGMEGLQKQEKAGLEWLNKAAAQNDPSALHELSSLYREGMASELGKSQEKANELLLKAANLGFANANSELGDCYYRGVNGFEEDDDEAYFRASVAFALDGTDEEAAEILGYFHFDAESIPEPSLYLACHYLNIAASEDSSGDESFNYSIALHKLNQHLHDGYKANGSDATPALLFWLRKSRDLGHENGTRLLKKLESNGQSRCANCSKKVKADEKLKQCSKCRAKWYCSKECQVEAWRAGHKKDCKRAAILKFEDYLNAE